MANTRIDEASRIMETEQLNEDATGAKASIITPDSVIKLAVGDRLFISRAGPLIKFCEYFKKQFSEPWVNGIKYEEDGSIYIEKDGDLFVHIMNYIRDGVFPLFYSAMGHDLHKYVLLLEYAEYFGVTGLIEWLKDEKYYDAIQEEFSYYDRYENLSGFNLTINSSQAVEFFPIRYMKKVYVCPRNIFVHRGKPERCGHDCEKARNKIGGEFTYEDDPSLDIIAVSKKIRVKRDKFVEKRD